MRDFETNPYTKDEERVAKWFADTVGVGGGDDPIGAMIASHMELARHREELRATVLSQTEAIETLTEALDEKRDNEPDPFIALWNGR